MKYSMLLIFRCYCCSSVKLYLTLKLKHLCDKKRLIYQDRISLQHRDEQNKKSTEHFTCDKLKIYLTSISTVLNI